LPAKERRPLIWSKFLHALGLTPELTRRRPTAFGSELADLGGRVE
jgi:hypothetical protein